MPRLLLCLVLIVGTVVTAHATDRLDVVKKRGVLHCGVNQYLPGFGYLDGKGKFAGFDVDLCQAMSVAIFGTTEKVKYVPLNAAQRFTALQSGEIDMLSRNTTWTASRDGSVGMDFAAVTFYDGQGFMVKKSLGVKSISELAGATICTNAGTTTEKNVTDYFASKGMKFKLITFEDFNGVLAALRAGRCDAASSDKSGLLASQFGEKNPQDYVILPETISKEPLGPSVVANNSRLRDVLVWTIYGMIEAEELGINSSNVDAKKKSADPRVQRLLGVKESIGKGFGVDNDFLYKIIEQVGNYGEVYARNLGDKSKFNMPRGLNALWSEGGLIFAPPYR